MNTLQSLKTEAKEAHDKQFAGDSRFDIWKLRKVLIDLDKDQEFIDTWLEKAYEAGEPEHLRKFAKRIEDLQDTNFPDLNQSLGYAMAIKDVLQRLYADIKSSSQNEKRK